MNGGPYGGGLVHHELNAIQNLEVNEREKSKADFLKQGTDRAKTYSKEGKIDDLSNLKNAPVFVAGGQKDRVVTPVQNELQKEFFE